MWWLEITNNSNVTVSVGQEYGHSSLVLLSVSGKKVIKVWAGAAVFLGSTGEDLLPNSLTVASGSPWLLARDIRSLPHKAPHKGSFASSWVRQRKGGGSGERESEVSFFVTFFRM